MVGQPAKIGKYDVLRVIGRGGMGVVYEALDPKLERHVAIKMILGATPGLLARFDREARSTGSLQHQNIVTIYEFGDQDGSPYLVMEFLEGISLDAAISSARPLSLANKLSICVDVCNGLNYAHDRGIIHRDIKPANVMLLDDGNVKIVDFGIARIGDTGISRTEIVGSLHYMSPEQFLSQPLDRRTDIFSTGVVLYQLLTGALPFQAAGSEAAVMYQIVHEEPPPLSSYLQDYPQELDEIIRKVLAKNRDLRYASARDLAFDLLAVMEREKHDEVVQWMKRADIAVQRTEWTKAEDCLRQVLKVDKHHTPAHQLLSHVQVRIREQKKVDQVRQLRTQADEAFLDRRYDEALRTVDQAVAIDDTNKDLLALRSAIQAAKLRAARLKMAMRRAEEAHQAGDLQEAELAVREALEIDPQETSVKALQVVILKQVEEQGRQLKLRTLFDNARDQISARNLTAAFQTLKEAEVLDPASVELYSLMKVVSAAREEQLRKTEIVELTRQIEEALNREDYAAAISIANDGLQRQPREQGLLRLRSLAETQQQRFQLKIYARDQFLAANALLEAGKTREALFSIENALRTIPGDPQLERLRNIAQGRLAADEAEERKLKLLAQAQVMAAGERFEEAARILESARLEFPGNDEIESLLEKVHRRAQQAKEVAQALDRAQQLLNQGSASQAVQFLEDKTLQLSDPALFVLLERARSQRDQFQSGLQGAIERGQRILDTQGATEAARFLAAQPAAYREILEFRALAEGVAARVAWEMLDQGLLSNTDPDSQIRLAEASLSANPGNEEIKKRLFAVRSRKDRISAVVEKARALEASRQYLDAAEQLQTLRQLYPQYPALDAEIRRLRQLEDQRLADDARRRQEQFRSAVQTAIEEGKRVLQQNGVEEATRYISAQPSQYRETTEFRAFAEVVAKRSAWEALDRDLASNTDSDGQIRLAEAALKENPGNEEIRRKLNALRSRKEQINSIAGQVRKLEAEQQYGQAAEQLQHLRQLHPLHPNIDSEIQRLEALEKQRSADEARRLLELFQEGVRKAVDEASAILRKQGPMEAARHLAAQPATYRQIPEFRALSEVVANRVASETLEQEFSRQPDPDAQVRAAETALRSHPGNDDIKKKLAAARSRREQILALIEKARLLETSRQYPAAAKELQKLRQLYPQYPILESEIRRLEQLEEHRLMEAARREAEQFQSQLRSALSEAQRILQTYGGSEAAKYLASQPEKYRETPEFRAFTDAVTKRVAWEGLDRILEANRDPDAQVRAAEGALEANAGNEEIKRRLAAVRSRREQINAIAEKVSSLEASRRYGKAAKELQQMRQAYPEYPKLEWEIRRLEELEEESKRPRRKQPQIATEAAQNQQKELGATVIMGRSSLSEPLATPGDFPSAALEKPREHFPQHSAASENLRRRPLTKSLLAVAAIVVIAGAGLIYRVANRPENVMVTVSATPADSLLLVDGVRCSVPCQRQLPPGNHTVRADHPGYRKVTQSIVVERGSQPTFAVNLPVIELPPPTPEKVTTSETPVQSPTTGPPTKKTTAEKLPPLIHEKPQTTTPAAGKEILTAENKPPAGNPAELPKLTPAPTGIFELNHDTIDKGQSAELTWNIQNATSVKIEGKSVNPSGSMTVTPNDFTIYHLSAAGQGGERDLVATIKVNIPSAKPKIEIPSVSEPDKNEITNLLQRYAQTFERHDAKSLQSLWPGIPKEQLKKIKESYDLETRVSFSSLQFIADPDGRVRILCTQTHTSKVKATSISLPFTMIVNQKAGHWVIDYIPIQ